MGEFGGLVYLRREGRGHKTEDRRQKTKDKFLKHCYISNRIKQQLVTINRLKFTPFSPVLQDLPRCLFGGFLYWLTRPGLSRGKLTYGSFLGWFDIWDFHLEGFPYFISTREICASLINSIFRYFTSAAISVLV
jgi:hypothetical protein